MNPLSRIALAFQRKRHSRGFGVHSTYAYRFVTDVVKSGKYGYYAYDVVDHDTSLSAKEAADAKFLVRMLAFLNRAEIVCNATPSTSLKAAANALHIPLELLPEKKQHSERCDNRLLVLENCDIKPAVLADLLGRATAIYATNPSPQLCDALSAPLSKGLLLKSKNKILLIPRSEMEYVAYDIDF